MEGDSTAYPHRKSTYPEVGTPELRRQIGKEMRSAREFQEMSLEQVAAITKINIKFLEAIEEGRWNFLPPTYVKAFIRAYSAAVGLQTDKLSNRLDELFAHVVVASAIFKPQEEDSEESTGSPIMRPKNGSVWSERHRALIFYGIIGVIAIVLGIVYIMKSGVESSDVTEESADTTVTRLPDASQQIQATSDTAARQQLPADTTIQGQTLRLEFAIRDTCFVKIEHNESVIYERTLWPGNELTLDAPHPIRLSLGNAPAVDIKVDGVSLPRFPSSRKAQVIKLGPGGIIG